MNTKPKSELLAPAGSWTALKAAVANGADAVYFGLQEFNARIKAENCPIEDLQTTIDYLHNHNVKAYIAFNTLIFPNELEQAFDALKKIIAAGPDAIIVQDIGIAYLLNKICPDLPVHASTQMTITDSLSLKFAENLGIKRAILARELNIDQIKAIKNNTPLELEVFIHGALCISYSGQCLASMAILNRSGNRGVCAQMCRLPYSLAVDSKELDLGDKKYLLSPKDLAGYELIGKLLAAGVTGFKIEGRLKNENYAASAAAFYRQAIDCASANKEFLPQKRQLGYLEQIFSRGFSKGYLNGTHHKQLIGGLTPRSKGIYLGKVMNTSADGIILEIAKGVELDSIKRGDGLLIEGGNGEQGGRIYDVKNPGLNKIEICFGMDDIDLEIIQKDASVWKTDDPAMEKEIQKTFSRDIVYNPVKLNITVTAKIAGKIQIEVQDQDGFTAKVTGSLPLQKAQKHPLGEEIIRKQFGRLGGTVFTLDKINLKNIDPVLVPVSELNELRRQAVEMLNEARRAKWAYKSNELSLSNVMPKAQKDTSKAQNVVLSISVKNPKQLEVCSKWYENDKINIVFCDCEMLQQIKISDFPAKIGIATPRIIKEGKLPILTEIANSGTTAVLARNLSAVQFFTENHPNIELTADYSLNVSNQISAFLLKKRGIKLITPCLDLNFEAKTDLISAADPAWFEIVINDHIPLFHSEYCLLAGNMGNSSGCENICKNIQKAYLKDRNNEFHRILTDNVCGTTIFSSFAHSEMQNIAKYLELGVRNFRINFLDETPEQIQSLLEAYFNLFENTVSADEASSTVNSIYKGKVRFGGEPKID